MPFIKTQMAGLDFAFPDVCLTPTPAGPVPISHPNLALPNARIMIHQPMGGFQGQASDIEIQAKEILRMKESLNGILKRHTGKDLKQIQRDTDRDYFMSGQEASDYGIVDHVIRNRDDLDKIE